MKKKEQLKKMDKKCKSQIVQRVADSHLEYVKDKETAFEIWTELISEKLTLSFVRTRLRDEDKKREGKQRKSKTETQPECRLNKLRSEHQQKQLKTRNANVATNNASNEGESEFSNQHSFSAYLKGNVKSTVWCLDSGASEHLVKSDNRVNKYAKTGASCVY
jgi:hypothetical protein